mmetsp:Transcript_475/g.938  ORF Transcript_475/g.938 Transcript_475/m.938 type:complete len:85 (-) Transcript_475:71-325(-)
MPSSHETKPRMQSFSCRSFPLRSLLEMPSLLVKMPISVLPWLVRTLAFAACDDDRTRQKRYGIGHERYKKQKHKEELMSPDHGR